MSSAIDALRNRGKQEPEPDPGAVPDLSEPEVETKETNQAEPDALDGLMEAMSNDEELAPATVAAMRKEIGARATSLMRQAVLLAREHTSVTESGSLLDDTIMSMRQSGLSHRKIAAELGEGVTEDEIADRLAQMYTKMEQVTTAEYRMLQVGRLEQVINMCWNLASMGSADHIELLVKAIERLNKMYELEKESAKIQVEVVTNAQAVMLLSIITGVLNVLTSDPRITKAVPIEELQQITAKALDVAEAEIVDEDGNVKTI